MAAALARTAGPFYGSLDSDAGLRTAVDTVAGAHGSEIILLHADQRRMRLLVNVRATAA